MAKPTLEERLEQIEGYAKALAQEARIMDERRHILEPLLFNNDIKLALHGKLDDSPGAHAFNHFVPWMAQDLLRDLARLYLDQSSKSASLTNLFRKANDPEIRQALLEKFRAIPDQWHDDPGPILGLSEEETLLIREEWRDKDYDDYEASFEKGMERASRAIQELQDDPVTNKIKMFRDKFFAHLEMAALGNEPTPFDVSELDLTYKEILDFSDRYIEEVFELIRVVTGHVHNLEAFSKAHQDRAISMWESLAK